MSMSFDRVEWYQRGVNYPRSRNKDKSYFTNSTYPSYMIHLSLYWISRGWNSNSECLYILDGFRLDHWCSQNLIKWCLWNNNSRTISGILGCCICFLRSWTVPLEQVLQKDILVSGRKFTESIYHSTLLVYVEKVINFQHY